MLGCDSASLIREDDADAIVVCGSHGGRLRANPGYVVGARLAAIVLNDAGLGKKRAGIGRIEPAAALGIAAVTVGHETARIGDALSAWETGLITCVNSLASRLGAVPGMSTQDFVHLMIQSRQA